MDYRNLTLKELENIVIGLDEKKFRAKQIYNWINKSLVSSFDEMNNIPKELRIKLEQNGYLSKMEVYKIFDSKLDDTKKILFELEDLSLIESVFMKYSHGNSVCISSQVGCKMKCDFCASTINGLKRNLTAGEMANQVYTLEKECGKVSNIVIMGSGEPFDNFENLIKFIEIINSKDGLNIGQRHITVSTCGIVPRIKEFADLDLQVNLAISLHSYENEKRNSLMPINKKYPIVDLIDACKYYYNKTNRRITFEYALIEGVNDSYADGKGIAKLLRGINCHVNLIPVNTVKEKEYSFNKNGNEFCKLLNKFGINATVRRKLGADIDAACGQLRNEFMNS